MGAADTLLNLVYWWNCLPIQVQESFAKRKLDFFSLLDLAAVYGTFDSRYKPRMAKRLLKENEETLNPYLAVSK